MKEKIQNFYQKRIWYEKQCEKGGFLSISRNENYFKEIKKILIIFYVFGEFFYVKGQTPLDDKNWNNTNMPINDHFNTGSINTNTWHILNCNNEWCWQWNNDLHRELYLPANVLPNIESSKVYFLTDQFQGAPNFQYHTGGIRTNATFHYGYHEINWQLSPGDCRWISFWLRGNTKEIDIMENLDNKNNNIWGTNVWYGDSANIADQLDIKISIKLDSTYNTVGLEWTPGILIFYLNNIPYREILYDYNKVSNENMNLFITPGVARVGCEPNLTNPDYTKVDWVKAWLLKPKDNSNTIIPNQTNFNTYILTPSLKNSINFAQGSNIIINSGQHLTFRATESITINGDFTINQGAEFTAIVHNTP